MKKIATIVAMVLLLPAGAIAAHVVTEQIVVVQDPPAMTTVVSGNGKRAITVVQNPPPMTTTVIDTDTVQHETVTVTVTQPTDPPPPPPAKQCADGVNNDPSEDSLIDLADPGCVDANDDSELGNPLPPSNVIQPGQSWDAAFDAASVGAVLEVAAGNHGSQTITGDKGGLVTIRAVPGAVVNLISLSLGGARNLEVDGVGTYGTTTMDVAQRPMVSSNVTLRNIKAKTLFIRTNDFKMYGGEIGGFDACAPENEEPVDYEDGIRIWNDGETSPSRRILIDGTRIHDIRRGGCSDHADSIQIWSGAQVTLRNLTVDNCPTECLIARPVNGTSDTLRDLLIEGGHYGPVLDGTQAINIGSLMELCTNIRVNGTTVDGAATFDCEAADGSWPIATVPDCSRFSGSVNCTETGGTGVMQERMK